MRVKIKIGIKISSTIEREIKEGTRPNFDYN